jgi:glycerol-3-phosphate cytidylyltransferase
MSKKYKKGIVAGNFDIIHPGYIDMFRECSETCDEFIILLHTDPSIERPNDKLKPILSIEDRFKILFSLRYVSNVYTYTYEKDLVELIKTVNPDVRFLGDDYIDKNFTGMELEIPIHYINRSHGWSTTKLKKLIHDEYRKKMKLDD